VRQKKLHSNWKVQRREWKGEQIKTYLRTIHSSKRVQVGKEDRFVYKETFLDLHECSYSRTEKTTDCRGLCVLSDRRRQHPGQQPQITSSVSSQ